MPDFYTEIAQCKRIGNQLLGAFKEYEFFGKNEFRLSKAFMTIPAAALTLLRIAKKTQKSPYPSKFLQVKKKQRIAFPDHKILYIPTIAHVRIRCYPFLA